MSGAQFLGIGDRDRGIPGKRLRARRSNHSRGGGRTERRSRLQSIALAQWWRIQPQAVLRTASTDDQRFLGVSAHGGGAQTRRGQRPGVGPDRRGLGRFHRRAGRSRSGRQSVRASSAVARGGGRERGRARGRVGTGTRSRARSSTPATAGPNTAAEN